MPDTTRVEVLEERVSGIKDKLEEHHATLYGSGTDGLKTKMQNIENTVKNHGETLEQWATLKRTLIGAVVSVIVALTIALSVQLFAAIQQTATQKLIERAVQQMTQASTKGAPQ